MRHGVRASGQTKTHALRGQGFGKSLLLLRIFTGHRAVVVVVAVAKAASYSSAHQLDVGRQASTAPLAGLIVEHALEHVLLRVLAHTLLEQL